MGPHEDTTKRHIEKFGWAVTLVPEDDEGPAFAYTTGLWEKFRHPELFIQGLPHAVMHAILNTAGERVRGGERMEVGARADHLVERFACGFRSFERAKYREYLGEAVRHYGGEAFDALQLLWPDANNRLPGDPGCDESVRRVQAPTLG